MEQGMQLVTSGSGRRQEASLRRIEGRLAEIYAAYAGSRAGRLLGQLVLGTFWALLLWSKGVHLVKLFATRPTFDTTAAAVSFWSVVLYHALTVVFFLLVTALVIIRKPAKQFVRSVGGAVAALAGTFLPSLLLMSGTRNIDATLAAGAGIFLVGGMAYAIWALFTLGRCLSMMPEVRGLVTSGPYSRVRHPLYLGEMVAMFGVLLPILSPRTVAIFVACCLLQLWRTRYEEETLSAAFPEYADYRRRTARVLPGIF